MFSSTESNHKNYKHIISSVLFPSNCLGKCVIFETGIEESKA